MWSPLCLGGCTRRVCRACRPPPWFNGSVKGETAAETPRCCRSSQRKLLGLSLAAMQRISCSRSSSGESVLRSSVSPCPLGFKTCFSSFSVLL